MSVTPGQLKHYQGVAEDAAELAALKRDAGRYRAIAQAAVVQSEIFLDTINAYLQNSEAVTTEQFGAAVDAAISACAEPIEPDHRPACSGTGECHHDGARGGFCRGKGFTS